LIFTIFETADVVSVSWCV